MEQQTKEIRVTITLNDEVISAPLSSLMIFADSQKMRSICKVVLSMVKANKTKKSFDLTNFIHVDITLKY